MDEKNKRREKLLGESYNQANRKLWKNVLFMLVKKSRMDRCHVCKRKIKDPYDLTLEHKIPWESSENPELFYDLDNIAFSHKKCNRPHIYRGVFTDVKGENNGKAVLTTKDVIKIRSLYTKDPIRYNYNKLSIRYRISRSHIRDIIIGRRWKHIPS